MIKIKVLRSAPGVTPFFQTFDYEPEPEDTVATALTRLNATEDLTDETGAPATPIAWECSCLQKKCGACAMIINGRPRLACDARLSELGKRITLKPLGKFPVVKDLIVDREILRANLKTLNLWLSKDAQLPEKKTDLAYTAGRCLQCGCCLEVCPNFYPGGTFFGTSVVPVTTRVLTETDKESRSAIAKAYDKHYYEGCGKSLACVNVCPIGRDVQKLLVNSNAMAIWKRK
ncbi:MAG: succinate dehydrogenase [Clostridia bacterium]|nr:succinate dehydrogenase [Clostridia bacterium]